MLLDSRYNLLGANCDTLTKLGTVEVDKLLDRKVWPSPATVVSSLAQPLILGLNFLKLTKLKIDSVTNTVETGSKIYPADTHCIKSYTSIIIIPTSDVYRPCQLLLNKKLCWMVIFTLITVIIPTAVASHTHCHFSPPFGKQDESFVSPERNLTWNELLTCGTSFTVRLLILESKKNSRLYLLDWALPPVLAEKLQLTDHLALGTYNTVHPQSTSLIQSLTHVRCHFDMKVKEYPRFPLKRTPKHSTSTSQFPILRRPFLYLPFLNQPNNGALTPFL